MSNASKDTSAGVDIHTLSRLSKHCDDCGIFAQYAIVEYENCVYAYDDLGGLPSRRSFDDDEFADASAYLDFRDPSAHFTDTLDRVTRHRKSFVRYLHRFDTALRGVLALRRSLNDTLGEFAEETP